MEQPKVERSPEVNNSYRTNSTRIIVKGGTNSQTQVQMLPDQLEKFTKVEQPKVEPKIQRSPEVETIPTESPQPESSLKVEPTPKYHP